MNLLNFEEYKKTIMKSVEVSTVLVLNRFFYISALPASAISKMVFVVHKGIAKKASSLIQSSKETMSVGQQTEKATTNNKETDTEKDNSSKASIGYSIIAGTLGIIKVINNEGLKDLFVADKLIETSFVRYADNINFVSIKKIINIKFIMMLLLAILLARRNVGDNNIINNNINNKNNRITRFI
jgi:hypothetical protein